MTEAPPALATPKQFTEEYWRKAPRETRVAHIERVTNLADIEGWVEIVMKEGMRIRRKREDIQQLLAPGAEVHIETFQNELVTGLFVPGVGWAFRMTAADLAQYTKDLSVEVHRRRMAAMNEMQTYLSKVLVEYFVSQGADVHTVDISKDTFADVIVPSGPIDPMHLARVIIQSMENAQ